MMPLSLGEFALRFIFAIFIGALVGSERQLHERMGGLRTNAIVSAGACLFVCLSVFLNNMDQGRIASYIVQGIGFLGAGVIMKEGAGSIRGLNTAATLWCSAALGALAGYGFYVAGLIGAVGIILTHLLLRPFGRYLNLRFPTQVEHEVRYTLRTVVQKHEENQIRVLILQTLNHGQLSLRSISTENPTHDTLEIVAEFESIGHCNVLVEGIVTQLSVENGVMGVSWKASE